MNNQGNQMKVPTLYIVEYWKPFPSSEYGGVQLVVAYTDAECERILAEDVSEHYRKDIYPDYRERIANKIKEAKRLPVDAEVGIVYEFTT
jgi:hypothetical protein